MERDAVRRKLAIVDALSRPDFGDNVEQWRQRWRRWECGVTHYVPQAGTSRSEAARFATGRQRMPGVHQRHSELNAMTYGEA